jgi:hypothetical protein
MQINVLDYVLFFNTPDYADISKWWQIVYIERGAFEYKYYGYSKKLDAGRWICEKEIFKIKSYAQQHNKN